jgi:hypothetical protein
VLLGYRDPAPGKLFVSHCAHDRALARKFVHLMRVAGVASERIFCVAQDSPRQEPRRPFDPEILRALESSVLITMLVTPNYLKSSSCCYDLGASWALGLEQFPLLVPPAPTSDLTDLVRSRVVYRIDSPVGLSALHSRLYELGLIDLPRTTWEDDVTSFLQNTRSYWSSGG